MNENQQAENDIRTILQREQITLADGREITVRAYTFMDSLRVMQIARPLITALQAYFDRMRENREVDLVGLAEVFAADPDAMVQLLEFGSDLTGPEIAELNDADGSALLWAWWNLNADFFTRRLVEQAGAQAAVRQARR